MGRFQIKGHVYLVSRPCFAPDVYKVGMSVNVEKRLEHYGKSRTVHCLCSVPDCRKTEEEILSFFSEKFELVDGKETFRGSLDKMKREFSRICGVTEQESEMLINFGCDLCHFKGASRKQLEKHLLSKHHKIRSAENKASERDVGSECELCGYTAKSFSDLKKHFASEEHDETRDIFEDMTQENEKLLINEILGILLERKVETPSFPGNEEPDTYCWLESLVKTIPFSFSLAESSLTWKDEKYVVFEGDALRILTTAVREFIWERYVDGVENEEVVGEAHRQILSLSILEDNAELKAMEFFWILERGALFDSLCVSCKETTKVELLGRYFYHDHEEDILEGVERVCCQRVRKKELSEEFFRCFLHDCIVTYHDEVHLFCFVNEIANMVNKARKREVGKYVGDFEIKKHKMVFVEVKLKEIADNARDSFLGFSKLQESTKAILSNVS